MITPSEGELHFDIGWLAGILDGEGSIVHYMAKNHDRRRGKHIIRYSKLTRVCIINTDERIVEKVLNILTKLDILAYVNQKSASKKQRIGSYRYTKPCFEIIISQRRSVEKILDLLTPHLSGCKKDKAFTVLDYYKTHPFNAGRKTPRVETERLAPNTNLTRFENIRMKLQSVLTENSKRVAEMTTPAFSE